MKRRDLLKMLCVAPALPVLNVLKSDEKQEVPAIKTPEKKISDRVIFEVSGVSLVGVLNRSKVHLDRYL